MKGNTKNGTLEERKTMLSEDNFFTGDNKEREKEAECTWEQYRKGEKERTMEEERRKKGELARSPGSAAGAAARFLFPPFPSRAACRTTYAKSPLTVVRNAKTADNGSRGYARRIKKNKKACSLDGC